MNILLLRACCSKPASKRRANCSRSAICPLPEQVQTLTSEFQERMKMVEMQMVQLQQMVMPDGSATPQAVEQQQLLYTQVTARAETHAGTEL